MAGGLEQARPQRRDVTQISPPRERPVSQSPGVPNVPRVSARVWGFRAVDYSSQIEKLPLSFLRLFEPSGGFISPVSGVTRGLSHP